MEFLSKRVLFGALSISILEKLFNNRALIFKEVFLDQRKGRFGRKKTALAEPLSEPLINLIFARIVRHNLFHCHDITLQQVVERFNRLFHRKRFNHIIFHIIVDFDPLLRHT